MINPGYFTSDFDILAAREGVKSAIKFVTAPIFNNKTTGIAGPFVDGMTEAEINYVLRNTTASGLHPVGTASMSPKGASWGVVDPDLSVKNVAGLRIIDASVLVSQCPYSFKCFPTQRFLLAVCSLRTHSSCNICDCRKGRRPDPECMGVISLLHRLKDNV
jgi:hypothetical protein